MSEQSGNWTGGDATVLLRLATWFVSVLKTGLVGQWGCYSLTAASYLVCVCCQDWTGGAVGVLQSYCG